MRRSSAGFTNSKKKPSKKVAMKTEVGPMKKMEKGATSMKKTGPGKGTY